MSYWLYVIFVNMLASVVHFKPSCMTPFPNFSLQTIFALIATKNTSVRFQIIYSLLYNQIEIWHPISCPAGRWKNIRFWIKWRSKLKTINVFSAIFLIVALIQWYIENYWHKLICNIHNIYRKQRGNRFHANISSCQLLDMAQMKIQTLFLGKFCTCIASSL